MGSRCFALRGLSAGGVRRATNGLSLRVEDLVRIWLGNNQGREDVVPSGDELPSWGGMKNTRRITCLTVSLVVGAAALPATQRVAEATLEQRIRAEAARMQPALVEVRRQIHMHPEVAGQEMMTAALVADRLRALGLDVRTDVGGHGVIGLLRGAKPGSVVAYRADMDAVPSPVVGDQPYRSRVPGVKHVCGHDAHVAVGLGIAEVLSALRADLPGTVKFLFQPAEENVTGARAMIAAGALDGPRPRAIFALHTAPFPVGSIGAPPGVGLTGWQVFTFTVRGADARGVATELSSAAKVLSTVPSLDRPDQISEVLGNLAADLGRFTEFVLIVGPRERTADDGAVLLEGMVRASGTPMYERARGQLMTLAERYSGDRASVAVTFGERFPDMHSDPGLVKASLAPIERALGPGKVMLVNASIPYFGEDFALFQAHVPGAMFFLGVANPSLRITAMNHMPDYDIDEAALEVGTAAMASVLADFLVRNH
jgi:metal-dependent amidase/aminoacylase/carboxypeptidase family protein